MMGFKVCFVIFLTISVAKCQNAGKTGVQMRLTEKGMHYAVDVGIKIMKEDLKGKIINEKGQSGNFKYNIQNLRITKAEFTNYQLTPVKGKGMKGKVSGIMIEANGKLWYSYKKNWFVHLSDTVGIAFSSRNIHFEMTLKVGASKNGHPTIDVESCSAGVDDIDLKFHGGLSWLYNLFRKIIADKLEDKFGSLLCSMAKEEINIKAKSELATFPVVKKLNDWIEIDYRLTAPPTFTKDYMDAYLKGEFKSSQNPKESDLKIPLFTASKDSNKMTYFWVTDYAVNTAAQVAHESGKIHDAFAAWDSKTPAKFKGLLNTAKFGLLFPKLMILYPNAPMSMDVKSYQPPKASISAGKFSLTFYALAEFKVKDKTAKIDGAFTIKFDIKASASVFVQNNNLSAAISNFDYDAKVVETKVGPNMISLDSAFVKLILDHSVINSVNPILKKGFPLPKVDEVSLENFELQLDQNVIRVGSDLIYTEHQKTGRTV